MDMHFEEVTTVSCSGDDRVRGYGCQSRRCINHTIYTSGTQDLSYGHALSHAHDESNLSADEDADTNRNLK